MPSRTAQSGFSIMHVLLLIALIGILGGTGWFVYNAQKDTKAALSSTPEQASKPAQSKLQTDEVKPESKIPDGYVLYEDKSLGFAFAHPKEWGAPKKELSSIIFGGGAKEGFNFRVEIHSEDKTEPTNDHRATMGFVKEGTKYYYADGHGNRSADDHAIRYISVEKSLAGEVVVTPWSYSTYGLIELIANLKLNANHPGVHLFYTNNDRVRAIDELASKEPIDGINHPELLRVYTDADVAMLKQVAGTFRHVD